MAKPIPVDHEWFLPLIPVVIACAFTAVLVYALQNGEVYLRGKILRRDENPRGFWWFIGLWVVVGILPAVLMAITSF